MILMMHAAAGLTPDVVDHLERAPRGANERLRETAASWIWTSVSSIRVDDHSEIALDRLQSTRH